MKPLKSKSNTHTSKKDTSWGGVADWYDLLLEQSGDTFQSKVIMPNILRIMDIKKGMNILDIACGQGYFSRAYAESGANVTACDISKELIEIAKQKSSKNILYLTASATDLKPLGNIDGTIDLATIVLAIQNIEDIKTVFSEAFRALKKGGKLIIIINHPAFRIPKNSSWQWDEKMKKQYRRIDAYMSDAKVKIDMAPGKSVENIRNGSDLKKTDSPVTTITFHRPLQSYFKALISAGFSITRLEEWISHKISQEGPRAEEEDRIRKEIPLFMCIEARK
jgi:ubiquinone/menaquinone biosynthesis C-methylase UbiE